MTSFSPSAAHPLSDRYHATAHAPSKLTLSDRHINHLQVLLKAAASKRFRLIVVDTRPLNEGLQTLAALSPYVRCVHTPLAGAAATMREATRVILGTDSYTFSASDTNITFIVHAIAWR